MPARYIETRYVDPAELHPYPGNPNRADVDELRGSVRANGQYRPVVVRPHPDGGWQILAGHGTTEATGAEAGKVRVEVHEADDATARRIVAIDNTRPRGSVLDEDALLALLTQAEADGGLDGTGYQRGDIDDLTRMTRAPDLDAFAEQVGPPGPGDGWPTLHLKVPHVVASAWATHLDGFDGDVPAALADLLGVDTTP